MISESDHKRVVAISPVLIESIRGGMSVCFAVARFNMELGADDGITNSKLYGGLQFFGTLVR